MSDSHTNDESTDIPTDEQGEPITGVRLAVDNRLLNPDNPLHYLVALATEAKRYDGAWDGDAEMAARWAVAQWCQEIGYAPDLRSLDAGEMVDRDEVPECHDGVFYEAVPDGGTEMHWDGEPCPRTDCEGQLQHQDQINVMCLACEGVWSSAILRGEHALVDADGERVTPRVESDGSRDIHIYDVAEDRPAISYGPEPSREGTWCLAATTGEERVELWLGEQAMYQLWTEVKGVPWPSQDVEGQAKDRLVRQVLHAANNADAEMLRDALAVLGDPDYRDVRTDGGQPVEDDEPETYTALTVVAARDAETQTLVLGRESEATDLQAAEEIDGAVAYVRREYEPSEVVSLPGAMTAAEVREWLDDHRDHRGFDGYDWAAHDRRERLEAHIEERQDYRNLVSSTVDRLEQVPVVSHSAGTAIGAIQQDLLDALQAGTPYVVDRTPDTGGEDEDER